MPKYFNFKIAATTEWKIYQARRAPRGPARAPFCSIVDMLERSLGYASNLLTETPVTFSLVADALVRFLG